VRNTDQCERAEWDDLKKRFRADAEGMREACGSARGAYTLALGDFIRFADEWPKNRRPAMTLREAVIQTW
jgi:hypothetical protein